MGLFDLPDEAKERLDALTVVGSNIATGLTTLANEVRKHRKAIEKQSITKECGCQDKTS